MSTYDENLMENAFFLTLQQNQSSFFEECVENNWIICVPRRGSLSGYALSRENIEAHVLIADKENEDDSQVKKYLTVAGRPVNIKGTVITIAEDDILYTLNILFDETFHNTNKKKYLVLCVDEPFNRPGEKEDSAGNSYTVNTLRDCTNFLWNLSTETKLMDKLEDCISTFLRTYPALEQSPFQTVQNLISELYKSCVKIMRNDRIVRNKIKEGKVVLDVLNLSVETFVLHRVYEKLMTALTVLTSKGDSGLNKIVRNFNDIHLRDLEVRADLYDAIPHARQELGLIVISTTPMGKLMCIKRAVNCLTRNKGQALTTDDMLPVLVYLIIKLSLPAWTAHFVFMKEFRFSVPPSASDVDENSFFIACLEAAIEHIKAGSLFGKNRNEIDSQKRDGGFPSPSLSRQISEGSNSTFSSQISTLFEYVKHGDIEKLTSALQSVPKSKKNLSNGTCHPLCTCEKCQLPPEKETNQSQVSITSIDDQGYTVLHIASLFGDPRTVETLLRLGASVNSVDFRGATPLHYAATKGNQNALLLLLHADADIYALDTEGNTALHWSCMNGHDSCVKALLYYQEHTRKPLNVNAVNGMGETPLHFAAKWGYGDIVNILFEYGAKVNIQNARKQTSLDCAQNVILAKHMKKRSEQDELIDGFVKVNVRPKETESNDKTPMDSEVTIRQRRPSSTPEKKSPKSESRRQIEKLFNAIVNGDYRLTCFYLGIEVDTQKETETVTTSTETMCHPLCTCEKCNQVYDTTSISRTHLDVNCMNIEGLTPLHVAASYGHSDIVLALLNNGGDANIPAERTHLLPLHLACKGNHVDTVTHLISVTKDVNKVDVMGNSPLHYSNAAGLRRVSRELLRHGANFRLKNNDNKTPLDC